MIVIPVNVVYNKIKHGSAGMDALRKEAIYTIKDIYALPDGQRAELIDGQIYYMAPPNTKHQSLLMDLSYQIQNYIKHNNGESCVFPAPFAVFLNENDKNYVEPDLSIIYDKNKITDKGCNGAPDWVIEIVSSSSKQMDYYKKLFKYRTAGVREYRVVDPEKKLVTIYSFERDSMEEYPFDSDITFFDIYRARAVANTDKLSTFATALAPSLK